MLKSSSDANYNFIHFTPLQTTGISGSCYSLYDHCELSGEIFNHIKREDFKTHEEWEISKQNYLQNIVQHMEKDYRMLSMVDIVLNHVSQNSPHLPLHKDMSYNLDNSPHVYFLNIFFFLSFCFLSFLFFSCCLLSLYIYLVGSSN